MSKNIQLSIPTPCHEEWDKMTLVDKGKFCGSCQKKVVDFSVMSDGQIAQFFKKPSTGSVCGRFMTDQLDREIEIPKKRIPWVKYFFSILLPAFFMTKASSQKLLGKVAALPNRDTMRVNVNEELRTLGMILPKEIKPVMGDTICQAEKVIIKKDKIEGSVVNERGEPIPFASISSSVPGKGIAADSTGLFEFSKKLLGNDFTILVSSVGYESKTILLTNNLFDESTNVVIVLKEVELLGEVKVKSEVFTKGLVCKVGGVSIQRISKKEKRAEDLNKQNSKAIKVYPNPVSAGSALSIRRYDLPDGYYTFQLLNLSGQLVQQKEIWVENKTGLMQLEIPKVAAGNYFLTITGKKTGTKWTERIIVQ